MTPDFKQELNKLYKEVQLKKKLKKDSERVVRTSPKIGNNDLCPCGSGKKYKKCCKGKLS